MHRAMVRMDLTYGRWGVDGSVNWFTLGVAGDFTGRRFFVPFLGFPTVKYKINEVFEKTKPYHF
jgi:hypothetical protein